MRVGNNPVRDHIKKSAEYTHQVVVPVFIPSTTDYYKDSLAILKLCLTSLFKTAHSKTFFTIVGNGCCSEVKAYLQSLLTTSQIQEVIHTTAIGKLNAIKKGISSHEFELITITDADILFKNGWQDETIHVFNSFPKAGVVGIIPQFKMFATYSYNVLFDMMGSKRVSFTPVADPEAMKNFYKSIGWDDSYDKSMLESHLTIADSNDFRAVVGAGHCTATYRKEVLKKMPQETSDFMLGGESVTVYLDIPVLKLGGWRLTTPKNYGYHMGNVIEDWMKVLCSNLKDEKQREIPSLHSASFSGGKLSYFLKNKLFKKVIKIPFLNQLFLKYLK